MKLVTITHPTDAENTVAGTGLSKQPLEDFSFLSPFNGLHGVPRQSTRLDDGQNQVQITRRPSARPALFTSNLTNHYLVPIAPHEALRLSLSLVEFFRNFIIPLSPRTRLMTRGVKKSELFFIPD